MLESDERKTGLLLALTVTPPFATLIYFVIENRKMLRDALRSGVRCQHHALTKQQVMQVMPVMQVSRSGYRFGKRDRSDP